MFWCLIFIVFLIALGVIDFYTMRLPDVLVMPFGVLGLLSSFFQHGLIWQNSLVSALVAGGVFGLISKVRPQGMGYGDAKYLAALGAWLGSPKILLAIFIASLMGSIFGSVMIFVQKRGLKQQIPFGPFLSLGACVAFFGGDKIFDYLLNLVLR